MICEFCDFSMFIMNLGGIFFSLLFLLVAFIRCCWFPFVILFMSLNHRLRLQNVISESNGSILLKLKFFVASFHNTAPNFVRCSLDIKMCY